MKVLFCTDGSKISFNAIKNFANWGKEVIVDTICIIDWSFLPEEIDVETSGFALSCANIADNILNYAEDEITKSGLLLGERIKHCGGAVEAIIERIDTDNYDAVVMGSHGKKGLQKWLGSVSRDVIENNITSSYVAKYSNSGKKMLITVDGDNDTTDAIEKMLEKLNLVDKEIYICMVNEDPNFLFLEGNIDTNWLMQIQKNQEQYAAQKLDKMRKFLENLSVEIRETAILIGIPAQEILNYAKSKEIDLIITGTRNKKKMDRFLSGSVSQRVLENTHSDVMIVKEGTRE